MKTSNFTTFGKFADLHKLSAVSKYRQYLTFVAEDIVV
jgi:hypothetical protein